MAIALTTLSAQLLALVPAANGQPTDYDQVVKDAVAQFGADDERQRFVDEIVST